jgi:hypothetical protein
MMIYILTSLDCKQTWPGNRYGWCFNCFSESGVLKCERRVVRMTTDPNCPVKASHVFAVRTQGRTAYCRESRLGAWYKSCLTPHRLFGDYRDLRLGNEAAAVRWLLGEWL